MKEAISKKNTKEKNVELKQEDTDVLIQPELIELSRITFNTQNPRKTFIESELMELAVSIKELGLISAITVRPTGDKYELVAGEKRFKSFLILARENPKRFSKIPCNVKILTDEEAFNISITENLLRSDVNPFEEADAFYMMVERFGYKIDEIALRFAKSNVFIYQRMKLRTLCSEAREYFNTGVLSLSHCMELIKINTENQKKALDVIIKKGQNGENEVLFTNHTPKALRIWISQEIQVKLADAVFDPTDAKLDKKAGACINCPSRSGHDTLLFNDIEQDDICFNSACFKKKTELYIDQEIAKEKKNGRVLLKVADTWDFNLQTSLDIMNVNQYIPVEETHVCTSDENCLANAIIVQGDEIGKKILISTKRYCSCHTKKGSISSTKSKPLKTEAQKIEELITEERHKYIHTMAYSRAESFISNPTYPGIQSGEFLNITILLLIDLFIQNGSTKYIDQTIEEVFPIEIVDKYEEAQKDNSNDEEFIVSKFLFDQFNKSEYNTFDFKNKFLTLLITKQFIDEFSSYYYLRQVKDGEAIDVIPIISKSFNIDTKEYEEYFNGRIQTVKNLGELDEDTFKMALEFATKNKKAYENYDISEYEDLLTHLKMEDLIPSGEFEEDSEEEQEAKEKICTHLVNYFSSIL